MTQNNDEKPFIKIDWGRQGGVIFAYLIALIGFFGIIANTFMRGNLGWRSFLDLTPEERSVIIWPYKTFEYILLPDNIYQKFLICILPFLLLFLICFFLTYKEDIIHYGIRASLWLVPLIVIEGLIFYGIMFPEDFVSALNYQFLNVEGYLNILILFIVNLSGSFLGIQVKRFFTKKRVIYRNQNNKDL